MDSPATEKKPLLTQQMRIATREIHNLSDALVNSKLVFGTFLKPLWKFSEMNNDENTKNLSKIAKHVI